MLHLEAAGVTASIDPSRGGRLASLRVGGRELLLGPAGPDDTSIRWGCYLMAPWAGRLANGRFSWQGRTIQLPRTHGRHAIHGLVWGRPWRVEAAERATATLSCDLPLDEWPMGGIVRQAFTLSAGLLTQHATINAGDAMPAALGWHPWFRRSGDVALRVPTAQIVETTAMLPTGRYAPASGRLDLRNRPRLGRRRIDAAYVGVEPPLELTWPDLTLRLETAPWLSTVVVFTPSHAVCVEPESAAPNALALPPREAAAAGIRMLEPGAALEASFTIAW